MKEMVLKWGLVTEENDEADYLDETNMAADEDSRLATAKPGESLQSSNSSSTNSPMKGFIIFTKRTAK